MSFPEDENFDSLFNKGLNKSSPIGFTGTNGSEYTQLANIDNYNTEELRNLVEDYRKQGISTTIIGNKLYNKKELGFLDKYGQGIKLGLGAANLGFNVFQTGVNTALKKRELSAIEDANAQGWENVDLKKQELNRLHEVIARNDAKISGKPQRKVKKYKLHSEKTN